MQIKKAYLAGGCFWGMEELFREQPGVVSTETGYTGGDSENPTYEEVESQSFRTMLRPGHAEQKLYAEALEVTYDADVTSFWKLLDFFFQIHNPTTLNQQGNDKGSLYRSAIFYQDADEKKQAEDFIKIVNDSKRWKDPVVTSLEPFVKFWPAEDYHQDFLERNPGGYTCHAVYFDSYLK